LTVYPNGQARPTASNLNFVAGDVRSNLVIVGLGETSTLQNGFDIYNAYGDVDVVIDLLGWFDRGDGANFTAINPTRLLDTRKAGGLEDRGVGTMTFPPDLHGSGVAGYALNVTATNTTQPSFLTVWPGDVDPAFTSMLNWQAGDTVPNQVIMRIPADGLLAFYNRNGHVDVIIDVVGIYWS
jgi:hypothetical protein